MTRKDYIVIAITILIVTFLLTTLRFPKQKLEQDNMESHVVVNVWKEQQIGTLMSWNPKFKAALDNGDTVICSPHLQVGDTIYYYYVNGKK